QSGVDKGSVGEVNDTMAVFQHVKTSMDYVNTSRIALLGHSRGGLTSLEMSNFSASEIAATIDIAGPDRYNTTDLNDSNPRNLLLVAGSRDINVDVSEMQDILKQTYYNQTNDGIIYGNITNGSGRKLYISDATHAGLVFDEDVMEEAIVWCEMVFYGSLRYPIVIDFKTSMYINVATLAMGVLSTFAVIYLLFFAFVKTKIITRKVDDIEIDTEGIGIPKMSRKPRKTAVDWVRPILILAAGIAAACAAVGIHRFFREIGLYGSLFGLEMVMHTSYLVESLEVVLFLPLVSLFFLFLIKQIEKKVSSKDMEEEFKKIEFKVDRKGKWVNEILVGTGLFVAFYAMVNYGGPPFWNGFVSIYKLPIFIVLLCFLVPANIISAYMTYGTVQSKFYPKGGKDSWAAFLIGILFRGALIGGYFAIGYYLIDFDSDIFLALVIYYVANFLFSIMSFHYFRGILQEAIFSALLAAWVFVILGG
ncbi:MAG: alpha/beta hydrolase family protein, partial [Candidatus Hodarchaeota archaeon]